jgi:hypothetical protein
MVAPMRCVELLALAALALSCTPSKPAAYPDHDKVAAEHKRWCDMLAATSGKGGPWAHQAECEAAYPTSSAAFLKRMTDCYNKQLEQYGDAAPDSGAMIADCSSEILATADPGDVSGTELYQARCERLDRCQQVSAEACAGGWQRLDGTTRAMLTSMYNLRAQAEIASCFADTDCSDEEDQVHDGCYRSALDGRVWLPLSLGHDPGITPDP